MKIDLFTKVILTVIAINLTYFSLKDVNIITKAKAEQTVSNLKPNPSETVNVNIVSCSPTMDVNLVEVKGRSVTTYEGGLIGVYQPR